MSRPEVWSIGVNVTNYCNWVSFRILCSFTDISNFYSLLLYLYTLLHYIWNECCSYTLHFAWHLAFLQKCISATKDVILPTTGYRKYFILCVLPLCWVHAAVAGSPLFSHCMTIWGSIQLLASSHCTMNCRQVQIFSMANISRLSVILSDWVFDNPRCVTVTRVNEHRYDWFQSVVCDFAKPVSEWKSGLKSCNVNSA